METIGDRSSPEVTRQDLANFYVRRNAQLQHKKYKLMNRWANVALTSKELDKISPVLDKAIGVLQQEQDSCTSRLERLAFEDKYGMANTDEKLIPDKEKRPSPTSKT
jgi:hypothetical protein